MTIKTKLSKLALMAAAFTVIAHTTAMAGPRPVFAGVSAARPNPATLTCGMQNCGVSSVPTPPVHGPHKPPSHDPSGGGNGGGGLDGLEGSGCQSDRDCGIFSQQ